MNNRKRSAPISMFVLIAVGGLIISVLNGDFNIGSYFEGLETSNLEVLLDYINLGLGFLVLAGVFIFFFVRAARGEKKEEYYWDFEKDQKTKRDISRDDEDYLN